MTGKKEKKIMKPVYFQSFFTEDLGQREMSAEKNS